MLNPQDLTKILDQANTGGIHSTLIVNSHGALVAFSGHGDSAVRIKATISSNIWSAYENSKRSGVNDEALQSCIISCETGFVGIKRVGGSGLLLCMFSTTEVGLGILKAKLEAMASYLNGPLNNIAVS